MRQHILIDSQLHYRTSHSNQYAHTAKTHETRHLKQRPTVSGIDASATSSPCKVPRITERVATGGRKDSRNEGVHKLLGERKEGLVFCVLYHSAKLSNGAQQRHRRLGKQLSDLPPCCELPCKLYCLGCPTKAAHQMPNGHCPSNYSRVRQGCRCWKVRWVCPLLYSPAQRSFLPARMLGRLP